MVDILLFEHHLFYCSNIIFRSEAISWPQSYLFGVGYYLLLETLSEPCPL
ncbi:hypothetical protein [Azospirillum doebereinerae]